MIAVIVGVRPKIGSSTSFNEACTTRSATVGIPNERTLPEPLGIVFCRTR